MSKDPAFLFYSNDFDSGTKFLTDEQVGKYLRLLISQHQHGHLTETQMLFICKTRDEEIFKKFVKDEDGKYFNEKLETEIFKRKAYRESRSKNRTGKAKKVKKHMKNISSQYVKHMEDENENKNEDGNKNENEKIKYAETILLTQTEYNKLCTDYGQQATQAAINYLDMYKQEKNYTTKSDYHTLKRWVIGAINKTNTHEKPKRIDYLIATDGSKIYQKDIDFSKLGK